MKSGRFWSIFLNPVNKIQALGSSAFHLSLWWERVKECKRELEHNRPFSPSPSPTNWSKKNKFLCGSI